LIQVKTGHDLPQNQGIKGIYTATLTQYEATPVIMTCKEGEITIENISNEVQVEWSIPKDATYSLSNLQGATTKVLNIPSDGIVTLTALLTKEDCKKTITQTLLLLPTGKSMINKLSGWIDGSCKHPEFNFEVETFFPNSYITWDISCTNCKNQGNVVVNGSTALFEANYAGDGNNLTVTALVTIKDDCGHTETKKIELIHSKKCTKGGTELQVNPNPASDQIEVFIEPSEDTPTEPTDPIKYEILITNPYNGAIKYVEKEIESGKTTIPLYNFEVGVYHLQVNTGTEIINKTFVVQE
jgi:hypothetical protein